MVRVSAEAWQGVCDLNADTMKDLITKLVATLASGLGGIGTFLAGRDLIAPEEVDRINSTGAGLAGGIVLIVVAILTHLALRFMGRNRVDGSGPGTPGIMLMAAACLLGGASSLSSCSGYPVTGSVSYRHPESGAKGGLVLQPGKPPGASLSVPIYDSGTGELIGRAELRGPLSAEVPSVK